MSDFPSDQTGHPMALGDNGVDRVDDPHPKSPAKAACISDPPRRL
jgi:hypothetical protein